MSAFSSSLSNISKHPLKKSRLGPPDVYPQEPKQKEDELSAVTLKQGFIYTPVSGDEYGSARAVSTLNNQQVGAYFNSVLAKKEEFYTLQDSPKKKPIFAVKDQFFLVGGKPSCKPAIEAWFKELNISKPIKPLSPLVRVPIYNKKEDVFMGLFEYEVCYAKAAWYIKLSAAHAAAQPDSKMKRKQVSDPALEWTQALLKCLKDIMTKLTEFYRISSSEKFETTPLIPVGMPSGNGERLDYNTLFRQWKYLFALAQHLYEEALLERHEVCFWVVDQTEKARTSADGGILKLLIPHITYFVYDILHSEILTRRLALTCVRFLTSISQPPQRTGVLKSPLAYIDEALDCPHHVVPVRGMITILHLIIIHCPAACVWNSLGEERSSSPLDGSPLDTLPVIPSELPISPSIEADLPGFKERVMEKQEEIQERSLLAEDHWRTTKSNSDSKITHIAMSLSALEALDRYAFHKYEVKDSPDANDDREDMDVTDVLYNNVLKSAPRNMTSPSWKSDLEPLIFLLCQWSVSTRRTGIHRGMVVACILRRFQSQLLAQHFAGTDPADLQPPDQTPYLFQESLMKFLDEEGPRFEPNGQPQDPVAFENLVLLFSELISQRVFSHDAYLSALISTGLISQVPTSKRLLPMMNPIGASLESPLSQQDQSYVNPYSPGSMSVSTPGSVNNYDLMSTTNSNSGMNMADEYNRRSSVPQSPVSYGYDRKPVVNYPSQIQPSGSQGPSFQPSFPPTFMQSHSFDESTGFPGDRGADGYERGPASVSSLTSEASAVSHHYFYVLHFPIPYRDTEAGHESNQRAVLLFGFGRAREQARQASKRLLKDVQKLLSKKGCYDISDGRGKAPKVDLPSTYTLLRQRFMQMNFFDRHVVSGAAVAILIDSLTSFQAANLATLPTGQSLYVPAVENIIFVMQLMEDAFNIPQLLKSVTLILKLLKPIEAILLARAPWLSPIMLPPVILFCVGMLRKYHCCLLLSQKHTRVAFEGLRSVVSGVTTPTDCTSAERCVLAYMYELFQACQFLQDKYGEFSGPSDRIRGKIMAKTKPSTQQLTWNRRFMLEFLTDPRQRPPLGIVKQLQTEPAYQHSFVKNAVLTVYQSRDPSLVNEIANFCAEMTACCGANQSTGVSGLTAEWVSAFQALCWTYNKTQNYQELVNEVDVSDINTHENFAILCCVLIARHCVRLEDFIGYVAIMTLMTASKQPQPGDSPQNFEAGGRLAAHIMLRLLQGYHAPPDDSSQQPSPAFFLKFPWDPCLLASTRRFLGVAPLLAVLKAMLVLSESSVSSRVVKTEEHEGGPFREISKPLGSEIEGLSDFAQMALREICQEETARECILKELEGLFSPDLLLDTIMSTHQMRHLVNLIYYPVGVAVGNAEDRLDDKQTMQRILRNLDQWNFRISWVELHLMLDQLNSPNVERHIDTFAKSIIDAFQFRSEEFKTNLQLKKGKVQSTNYELEPGEHVWYLAPLVAKAPPKLPPSVQNVPTVQNRIINRQVIGIIQETGAWSLKSKDREKLIKSTLLLGHPPFVSLIQTCVNHPEDLRENLLRSLHEQLSLFAKEDRVYTFDDTKFRSLLIDALSLRLSLVGSLFDVIQSKLNLLQEWALLLAQLITSGCVDPVGCAELFTIVMDMLMVLIHTALAVDPGGGQDKVEERKVYFNLVKKIKKEIGDKLIAGVEHVRTLLPLQKKTLDVIAVEPAGNLVDTKGNKIGGFDSPEKKEGLQASSKVKLNPWEVLEGFGNPYPLAWSFFHAIRADRRALQPDLSYRLQSWHNHPPTKPLEYFLEPPPVPPEEEALPEKPAEDPANSETTSVETSSPRSERSRQPKAKKPAASKKRQPKSVTNVMNVGQQFLPNQPAQMMPFNDGTMMQAGPSQQPVPPNWYNQQGQPGMQQRYPYPPQPQQFMQSEMNRPRMISREARQTLQSHLQARSQPQMLNQGTLQQMQNPTLNSMLSQHRTNGQMQPGVGSGHLGMPQGQMGHVSQPANQHMGYGMRPPGPGMSTGSSAEADFILKQQQQQQRYQQQQQQQQQQMRSMQNPGSDMGQMGRGGVAGPPYGGYSVGGGPHQMAPPEQVSQVMFRESQQQQMQQQQQNPGMMSGSYIDPSQQQQQQVPYRQGAMPPEYLQQQYQRGAR